MNVVRLRTRTVLILIITAVAGLAAFTWPLVVTPSTTMAAAQAPLVFGLVLPFVLAIVLAELSGHGMDTKGLAMLGVLSAVGAALRPLGAGTAGLETVFFLLILGGRVFGPGFGFAQGAVTLLASALVTGGVGPWMPYQMIAAGFVGLGAGLLPRASGTVEVALLATYGAVSAFVFGWLLDFAFWPFAIGPATDLSFVPGAPPLVNLQRFFWFNMATSMGWNLGRALTNVALLVVLAPGLLLVLRRTARCAAFVSVPFDVP